MNTPTARAPVQLTDEVLDTEVFGHINRWLFGPPGDECYHTPSIDDEIRADKYAVMLRARMLELASRGTSPVGMTAKELLPAVQPYAIELSEKDFLAYC